MNLNLCRGRLCHDQYRLEKKLECLADAGPEAITDHLKDLEKEWSVGRMTKATIGVMIIIGISLSLVASLWWLLVPAVAGVFLLQYLVSRTSWLATFIHQLGFRTGAEIDQEKYALKTLRGDFRHLPIASEIENKDDIARLEGEGGIVLDPEEAKPDAREAVREVLEAAKI